MTWLVYAEESGGKPTTISLEMLTKARSLGGEVAAFAVGAASESWFNALGAHGASRVHHLDPGDALPSASAAAAIAALVGPGDVVLLGLTQNDRDVAGRHHTVVGGMHKLIQGLPGGAAIPAPDDHPLRCIC